MPRVTFNDIDDFADAMGGIDGRFVPIAASREEWWLETATVGRLTTQMVQIGGPSTYAGSGKSGSVMMAIPLTDPRQIRVDGHSLPEGSFILVKGNQPFMVSGQGVVRWIGIVLPEGHESLACSALQHTAHAQAKTAPQLLDKLRSLIAQLMAMNDGNGAADPAALHSAEEEIALATARVLQSTTRELATPSGRPKFARAGVIAKALALIEENSGQPLFIDDLCTATQVNERTLRNMFLEYFGVGPIRLLKLRQLREIRKALLTADPARETVTSVAARYGVWDFSLFARNYKALFDELPSLTLRRGTPLRSRRSAPGRSWIEYAARRFANDAVSTPKPVARIASDTRVIRAQRSST